MSKPEEDHVRIESLIKLIFQSYTSYNLHLWKSTMKEKNSPGDQTPKTNAEKRTQSCGEQSKPNDQTPECGKTNSEF